ncbi:c-type cytochrome [Sulfitobacter aestuarii]|uniref:C-type cytochrome n=1 Tax=Sulfitobacter aestuarii TaxID=2161676 RepID=A0ABW5U2E1_9RHOB
MRRLLLILLIGLLMVGGLGWALTRPADLERDLAADHQPDPEAGALVFTAAGCASCHAAPKSEGEDRLVLTGGMGFASDFGTFHAPNISPHPEAGIGSWSFEDFARALTRGVSPEGEHYYPAFPYTAYQHMTAEDLRDLFAYMQSLPPDATPSRAHEVGFPFNIRRGLGLWKRLFMAQDHVVAASGNAQLVRGRYLVEALAHCGECHTPRNALGGLDRSRWLAGAPNLSGKGRIPNITPGELSWSEADLMGYFTTGFTPDYDTAGGEMAEVVDNLAQLPESDRAAIITYLKALPPIP